MRRQAILFVCLLVFPASAVAAPADSGPAAPVWNELTAGEAAARSSAPAEIRTRAATNFSLDHTAMRAVLADAPRERSGRSIEVTIAAPDGTLERFAATESPVLAPAQARRFPQIRTYSAKGLTEPGATARFDLTPLGFHASVRSDRGLWYVDPRFKGERGVYASYYRTDLVNRHEALVEPAEMADELARELPAPAPRAPGDQVNKRVYRLAIANDPSYATYFGGTDLLVESAKATLVNRVNQLYNDDLAVRMEIVDNDELLNFNTADKYTAAGYTTWGATSALITENDTILDTKIGNTNYDVGHIVGGSDFDGGGIAGLGVVGAAPAKAAGCTGPQPADRRRLGDRLRGARDRPPVRRPAHLRRDERLLRRQPLHRRRLGRRARQRQLHPGLRGDLRHGQPPAELRSVLLPAVRRRHPRIRDGSGPGHERGLHGDPDRQPLAGRHRARRQDDPDPDAVHPGGQRDGRRQRRPGLPLGAERRRRGSRAGADEQRQVRRSALPRLQLPRRGGPLPVQRARAEPRQGDRPRPHVPGPGADRGRQHERRDRPRARAPVCRRSTATRSTCRPLRTCRAS